MKLKKVSMGLLVAAAAGGAGTLTLAQQATDKPAPIGYDDTPLLPDGKWRVHDGKRPRPTVISGTFSSQETPGKPPSDAVVLFDGKDLSKWRKADGGPAGWKVESGYMEIVARAGDVFTRDEFGDCQLHMEWSAPDPPRGSSQGRGNSGVWFMSRYELQILDSHENVTYADGQAAALYGQFPPLVNASRKPGDWQVYDVIFIAPRFREGRLDSPAYVTVFHNGVVVHNHTPLMGAVAHRAVAQYTSHEATGPLKLQDHGDPVRFRNVWVRRLKGYDQP